jgi:hypothetical protein
MKRFLVAVFYWQFNRGSWPWDLCCLFHIAIIFATPRDFLECYTRHPMTPDQIRSIFTGVFGL